MIAIFEQSHPDLPRRVVAHVKTVDDAQKIIAQLIASGGEGVYSYECIEGKREMIDSNLLKEYNRRFPYGIGSLELTMLSLEEREIIIPSLEDINKKLSQLRMIEGK